MRHGSPFSGYFAEAKSQFYCALPVLFFKTQQLPRLYLALVSFCGFPRLNGIGGVLLGVFVQGCLFAGCFTDFCSVLMGPTRL